MTTIAIGLHHKPNNIPHTQRGSLQEPNYSATVLSLRLAVNNRNEYTLRVGNYFTGKKNVLWERKMTQQQNRFINSRALSLYSWLELDRHISVFSTKYMIGNTVVCYYRVLIVWINVNPIRLIQFCSQMYSPRKLAHLHSFCTTVLNFKIFLTINLLCCLFT